MNINPNTPSSARTSALSRLLGFVLIVLLVISSLVLLLFLARFALTWVIVPFFVEKYVSELGRVAGWDRDITWAVIVAAVFVVSYVVQFVSRRGHRQRRTALGVLSALAVSYFSLHACFTRNQLYDQHGQPLFYWGLTPLGEIFKQPKPGINPYTGTPLLPASLDYFVLIRTRLQEPLRQVDPATHDWFDLNCGYPLLWYVRNGEGALDFYSRPAIHPRYRAELQPVSVELLHEWEREQARRKAEADAQVALAAKARHEDEARRKAEAELQRQAEERQLELARLRDEETRREADRARDQQASEEARRRAAEDQAQAKAETERRARLRAAAQEIDRLRATPPVATGPTYDWQTPRPSAIESPRWTIVPAQSQPAWVQAPIVEPVASIVRMPFQIVGSVVGGVPRPAGGRIVRFVTVTAGARSPGSVTARPVVRPAGYWAPAVAPLWHSPSPCGYATPSRAPANSGTSGHRYGHH